MQEKNTVELEDEIDLYEIFLILKKRFLWIVFTMVAFLTIAIVYVFLARPVYQGTCMVVVNNQNNQNNLSPEYLQFIINNHFNFSSLEKTQVELEMVNLLHISRAQVSRIVSIKGDINKGGQTTNTLTLILQSYDPKLIKPVLGKLVDYLNNTQYVRLIISGQKELLEYQKNELKKSLSHQIELSNKIEQDLESGKLNIVGFNPLSLQKEIINTKTQIKNIDYQLSMLGIKMVNLPYVSEKPVKPKKLLIIAISLVSSLFIGVFLAFFVEWLENVKKKNKI